LVWPNTLSRASWRGTARPLLEGIHPGGILDRVDDLGVAGAPAEVARDALADLVTRRRRVLLQQRRGGEDHARAAEAALHGAVLDEGGLQGVWILGRAEPLGRHDAPPVGLYGKREA
jgi:hypothetical protein